MITLSIRCFLGLHVGSFVNFFLSTLICLDNSVCHLGNDQLYGTDCVVVARDYIIQFFRITVGIANTDKRNTQGMSFLYADSSLFSDLLRR